MKKFILKIGLFFLALIVVDRGLGLVFAYMGGHAKGGYIGHHKYVTDKTHEDILIFGSSRAIHHYNPEIISDSLGMTCYNCGQDGNGIILFYGLWQMIKERYRPKMIIYDVTPDFDISVGDDNQRFLGWLRLDYDRRGIKDIFAKVNQTERYKMICMLYRYNSKFVQILTDYLHPIYEISRNGFLPMEGNLDKMKIKESDMYTQVPPVDSAKLWYLEKLIDDIDGTQIVFVSSPSWYRAREPELNPIKEICDRRSLMFLDFSNSEKYVHQDIWFKDGMHLNSKGADEFTKDLVHFLRKEI